MLFAVALRMSRNYDETGVEKRKAVKSCKASDLRLANKVRLFGNPLQAHGQV